MLHTNFKGHRPFGSREEDCLRFLPYMGIAAILVMWPGPFEQNFVPPSHGSSIWNLTLIGPVVSEKQMFKVCGRWTTMTMSDNVQHSSGKQGYAKFLNSTVDPRVGTNCLQWLILFLTHQILDLASIWMILSSEQQRCWSDCTDARADLHLCCSYITRA